jgi:hypothetical protein
VENIVKTYPTDKFNLIDANTNFSITSEDKNGGLTIEAYSHPSFDSFINIMDFSTGELTLDLYCFVRAVIGYYHLFYFPEAYERLENIVKGLGT